METLLGGSSVGLCRGWTKNGVRCTQKAKIGSNYCHWHENHPGGVAGGGVWSGYGSGPPSNAPKKESKTLGVLGFLALIGLTLVALWCLGVAIWLVVELIGWLT